MSTTSDFLEPNSMLTPGIAGGLTVTITTALYNGFGLGFNWTALIVSCILAFLIISSIDKQVKISLKTVYFVLNTLIIFSVTQGASVTIDPPFPA